MLRQSLCGLGVIGVLAMPAVAAPERPPRDVLTEDYARFRSEHVSNVAYDLSFRFDDSRTHYTGEATIRFDWQGPPQAVSLDYRGKSVDAVLLNGRSVKTNFDGNHLTLPGGALKARNQLKIRFTANYDSNGDGLQRFVDPLDKRVYLYTNFEPYAAHRLFPCFDQPDLKAVFRTQAEVPQAWVVIGNAPTTSRKTAGDRQMVTVQATPQISPYLYALHAGPYAAWHATHGKIPMAIYARRSLAKHMEAQEIFEITGQGLDFFGGYFDYPYPFAKYDQIFVPEFNSGAMENPGAVTLNEWMLFRYAVTDQERFDRDQTILHEMAHMWFGDLVTMRWWNDLWLNESFASYMETLSKVALPRYGDAWLHFYGMKQWAYGTDELVTTHPIEAHIPDTDAALANFDGITYGKGASVMKQLAYYIGADAFRDGVRQYFKRHAFGNATLKDFMGALQSQTKEDLGQWANLWLQTPGFNTIQPQWTCLQGVTQEVNLKQGIASGASILRPHRTEIGVFGPDAGGKWVVKKSLPVAYHQAETAVPELSGTLCPPMLFANYGDQDYVKVYLDDWSLRAAKEHLSAVADPMMRHQLWGALWVMVRDHQLPASDFLAILERHLPSESDPVIVERNLDRLATAVLTYMPAGGTDRWLASMEPFVWDQLTKQAPQSDLQMNWADTYIRLARNAAGVERLYKLLSGAVTVQGLEINQDMRWAFIQRLSNAGHPQAAQLLVAELERDPSDHGRKQANTAIALRPDAQLKEQLWRRFLTDKSLNLGDMEAYMLGFNGYGQEAMLKPFVSRYFEALPGVYAERELSFASEFAKRLFPARFDAEILAAGQAFLKRNGLPRELRKLVMERNQEIERVMRIRALVRP